MSRPARTLLNQFARYVSTGVFIHVDDATIVVNGFRIIVACGWVKKLRQLRVGVNLCMGGRLPPFYNLSIIVE